MAVLLASAASPALASATAHHHRTQRHAAGTRHAGSAMYLASDGQEQTRPARLSGGHVIQCVAFAKQDAGIEISGNARDWWDNAAGVYDRGNQPEPGSVLSFLPTGRMRLGHVAVVSGVVDSRTIVIDQSHWNSSGISRDMLVKDVSENNDWTQVRVELGHAGAFGSIYPTHGFIYPRSAPNAGDRGIVRAVSHVRPRPALEVAEAAPKLDLTFNAMTFDAPYRDIR